MITRLSFPALLGLVALVVALFLKAVPADAAEYAAIVIDARTGEVLHSRNADTRVHPASLTKMMTLYITFEAIEHGEISLDDDITISAHAAAEPPSKLGMRPGQKIKLRYLIRAAAIKSANDAATALGEAIEGSEAAFARRMNRTAKALGMTRTTFKNANGLTEDGHLSTARDMVTLGRHLFYDYPEYYNLFSRITADAGIATVSNTNRKFLSSYRGADGIKTGYTRAAGFNLVASAERGRERIMVAVLGGRSTASRNAEVAELMDLGFKRAPSRVAVIRPEKPPYGGTGPVSEPVVAQTGAPAEREMAALAVIRPPLRPGAVAVVTVVMAETIDAAVSAAQIADAPDTTEAVVAALETDEPGRPGFRPRLRPGGEVVEVAVIEEGSDSGAEVVSRLSTSGERYWGVSLGRYDTRTGAEKALLRTALAEIGMLDQALRKVVPRGGGYEANFLGLTHEGAELACRRLQARAMECSTIGPS